MEQGEPFLNSDVFNVTDIAEIEGILSTYRFVYRVRLNVTYNCIYFRLLEWLRWRFYEETRG